MAIYVEDEAGPETDRFEREIGEAGFSVVRDWDAQSAIERIRSLDGEIVDLFVLDRKIPSRVGSAAVESVGDELFRHIEENFPDAPIIVLTGHSDEVNMLHALHRVNSVEISQGVWLPRISYFRKADSLQFRNRLRELASALISVEDVYVEGEVGDTRARRVLKRAGHFFQGAIVSAREASTGASDASVWLCSVRSGDGRRLADIVVKVLPVGAPRVAGGFMAAAPRSSCAQPNARVEGACGGLIGEIAPLAAPDARSLMQLIEEDELEAVRYLRATHTALATIDSSGRAIPLAEFVSPLVDWRRVSEIAHDNGLAIPSPSMLISGRYAVLHGDLHPANVLIVDGEPVFIDFDRQRSGSPALDYVSLALGAIYYRGGSLRARLPSVEALLNAFQQQSVQAAGPWLDESIGLLRGVCDNSREYYAAAFAYAMRQCRYPDVRGSEELLTLALSVASWAAGMLLAS